jgi:hypothetical protein
MSVQSLSAALCGARVVQNSVDTVYQILPKRLQKRLGLGLHVSGVGKLFLPASVPCAA